MKPENLVAWTEKVPIKEIDAILEWLADADLLNQDGLDFARDFWEYTWKKPKPTKKMTDQEVIDDLYDEIKKLEARITEAEKETADLAREFFLRLEKLECPECQAIGSGACSEHCFETSDYKWQSVGNPGARKGKKCGIASRKDSHKPLPEARTVKEPRL